MGKSIIIPAVGLDVGYSGVKGAFRLQQPDKGTDKASRIECFHFPSQAPVVSDASLQLVASTGMGRVNGLFIKDKSGAVRFAGPDVSQFMGNVQVRDTSINFATSATYEALYLASLHQVIMGLSDQGNISELKIQHLVGGLPFNTLSTHKAALQALMKGEHVIGGVTPSNPTFRVHVLDVSVMAQPAGSQLLARWQLPSGSVMQGRQLVIDLGGGTFDWYCTEEGRPVFPLCDSLPKGVLNCAMAMANSIARGGQNDPALIGRLEAALRSGSMVVRFKGEEMDLGPYINGVWSVLQECFDALSQKMGDLALIDAIHVTGGGGSLFYEFLLASRPDLKAMIHLQSDPVFSNARGFFLMAQELSKRVSVGRANQESVHA